MHILIVEDYENLGDAICNGLRLMDSSYTVDWMKDGETGLNAMLTQDYDAVVLDIGLPKRSGLEVLKIARKNKVTSPVLILTARDSIQDKVDGLDSGADDYLVKPFELKELAARLRSLRRRSVSRADPVIRHGELELDPAAHIVRAAGMLINLSRREFALLQKMLEEKGRVLSRDALSQTLYGWGEEVDSNAIEVHVHNLRKKLADHINIQTVRGVGYTIQSESGS